MAQIAILTADRELTQHRLPNDLGQLEPFFAQLPTSSPIAIETSGTWWWLVDLLERLGHRPVLSHPKETKAIASARSTNDKVDAQRLALLLRGDLLPTVWIPPAALREARELVRHRVSLIWLRTQVRNRLLTMLARRNLQPTQAKRWLTVRGQRDLQTLALPAAPTTIREDCLALLAVLDAQIRRLDTELGRVQRLMTIPGIGPFLAILLVLELGDVQRFPSDHSP
jgi:transposase